jgi:hypothetical protein
MQLEYHGLKVRGSRKAGSVGLAFGLEPVGQ